MKTPQRYSLLAVLCWLALMTVYAPYYMHFTPDPWTFVAIQVLYVTLIGGVVWTCFYYDYVMSAVKFGYQCFLRPLFKKTAVSTHQDRLEDFYSGQVCKNLIFLFDVL